MKREIKLGSILTVICVLTACYTYAQKATPKEYINKYKSIALEHQEKYGIPASIKLAQGLLESNNGNSRLAVEANNHFGIKCKSYWKGKKIYHDDDALQECFRGYNSAKDSYVDHSEFLDKGERYQKLFTLDPLDYKGWARELKAAGYATNPKYPEILIKIIEDNKLYLLDRGAELPDLANGTIKMEPVAPATMYLGGDKINLDNYIVSLSVYKGYILYGNNMSEFVIAAPGDSFGSMSAKLGISERRLRSYNDMKVDNVKKGSVVYLKRKAKKSYNSQPLHVVKSGETLHAISQEYGVRLKSLAKMNNLPLDAKLEAGKEIVLR